MRRIALAVLAAAALTSACERIHPRGQVNSTELYQQLCARCHGANGSGGVANNTGPAPRDFRSAAWQEHRTDAQIKATIRTGRGSLMPGFPAMSDAQLDALVSVVRGFWAAGGARGAPTQPAAAP